MIGTKSTRPLPLHTHVFLGEEHEKSEPYGGKFAANQRLLLQRTTQDDRRLIALIALPCTWARVTTSTAGAGSGGVISRGALDATADRRDCRRLGTLRARRSHHFGDL
jgi:hypothetical protein